MTVPQAKAIDEKFLLMKDSIKLLNVSLFQNRENLRLTNEHLKKTNVNLTTTQESLNQTTLSLNQTTLQNKAYLKEIERYKKMEFEDKKVMRRTTIGFATVAVFWVLYVVSAMAQ